MILPDFVIPEKSNVDTEFQAPDRFDLVTDKKHFVNYPHKISYKFNSRGFRDKEWPETIAELKQCIWCFGDSSTVGIGSPLEHTWVNLLEQETGIRCINVSAVGTSNDWISRKIKRVIEEINPANIVVQWTYLHRGESNDTTLSDHERKIMYCYCFEEDCLKNFKHNLITTSNVISSTMSNAWDNPWKKVTNNSYPTFPYTIEELDNLPTGVLNEIKNVHKCYDDLKYYISYIALIKKYNVYQVDNIDYARDNHHYDIITAKKFIQTIIGKLEL